MKSEVLDEIAYRDNFLLKLKAWFFPISKDAKHYKQRFAVFFESPVLSDPAVQRVAKILNIIIVSFLVCNLLGFINMLFFVPPSSAWMIAGSSTIYGVAYYFLHSKRIKFASWLTLGGAYITTLLFALLFVSVDLATVFSFAVVIAIAGVVFNPRDSAIIVGAVLVTLTTLQMSAVGLRLNVVQTVITYVALVMEGIILSQVSHSLTQSYKELENRAAELASLQGAVNEGAIVAITDEHGRIEFVNDNFLRISKYSRGELIGQDHGFVNSGYHSKEFICNLWDTITSGDIWRGEVRDQAKDGSFFWMDTIISPVLDERGTPRKYLVVRFDITERKRAEEIVHQSEARLAEAAQIGQLGYWELDVQTQMFTFTDQFYALFRTTAEEQGGYQLSSEYYAQHFVHPDDLHIVEDEIQRGRNSSDLQYKSSVEHRILYADGGVGYVLVEINRIRDEHGKVLRHYGTSQDITERKQTEETIRQSEAQLAEAADMARLGYWEFDFQTQIFTFSDPLWAIFRTTAEEQGGYQVSAAEYAQKFLCPGDILIVNTEIQKSVEAGVYSGQAEHRFIRSDGSEGYLGVRFRVITDADGQPLKTVGIDQDITEQKRASLQLQKQLRRVQSLRNIDLSILSATDLRVVLKTILEETIFHLRVDAAVVHLFNANTLMLEPTVSAGEIQCDLTEMSIRLGEGLIGNAALKRRTLTAINAGIVGTSSFPQSTATIGNTQTIYTTPLISKGNLMGVLSTISNVPLEADKDWTDYFETLAGQTAMAIDSSKSFEDLQRTNFDLILAYDTTIEGWSHALDLRDKETEGHTQRVTEMTLKLARAAGMTDDELVHVRRGALLHDIGKIGIPDKILHKQGVLTEAEWEIMRQHPVYAREMLFPITYLHPAIDIPYYHHEKWDGTGYPRSLKGEQIPLAARLFAVVDVWDALRSDRPYRKGWPEEDVLEYVLSQAGTHFDPKVVELFMQLMKTDI